MELLLEATGHFGPTLLARINKLDLNAPFTAMRLQDPPLVFTYSDKLIDIRNISFTDEKDSTMLLKAEAMISLPDSMVIRTNIKNFNLEILENAGILQRTIKGRGFLDLRFSAKPQNVTFTGSGSLTSLELDPFNVAKITAQFNYSQDSMRLKTSVLSPLGDSILLEAASRLKISWQDSLSISWPKTFRAHLTTHQTRLNAFYLAKKGTDQPKGLVTIDLKAQGHLDDPVIQGNIDLSNGELPLPKYGINYSDVRLKLNVDGPNLQLDTLFLRHLKGTLLARGSLQMKTPIMSGQIKSSDLRVVAKDFYVSRHRDHEIQVDANINFRDTLNSSKFGGIITVLQSSFFIPALIEMADKNKARGEPLLVQAMREKQEPIQTDTLVIPIIPEIQFTFMEKLAGRLKVEIPRNTWIKSDDMQVEVFGSLDVVKNSAIFEFFGTMGIHRGYYTLYGKKLVIEEGTFQFSGGETLDPLLDIKAIYIFRGQNREKRELFLLIKGKATVPEISFELDKQIIPEADAMAYLLFGQPFEELSYGNQEGVSNAIPSRLVSGLVSSQLSRTLGNTLSLDMIEIDAGDNWENTTFMVGKYITNNLFVTYQKSFGQVEEQEITPEVITLEYEIGRHISLRLIQGNVKESGVDLILKFEK
jgi:translocation and assembly module TamB